ncbi:chromosome segregation protein SMC [Listeria booriae]|uniref:Chromosome partition protein Smc n=1 Tax=Listeria booriae TaxID=1552123 RepID=A0A842GCQ2_9LIST|nr:chromosome segregation protein SMC [Listeria booriae]MBC2285129.1 chromosome segregation protein SMC [Listeria booriae]MBC2294557.1 chromosome segregation protein SMC [Listeria booriae]
MLLKKLEMNGFKSFADKMVIDFVPGTTAIVGPNGSGKSNITEAIRWVLGEQSAKSLRGGRMGDVIFAGSDTRKPINFAEVSLIFENEDRFLPLDYSEVSVTRRIFRNGDSEFLINKQSCRLKDIVDLFMDSGLGRESFSIISQGKIDEILNSKPEERRSIFEEAAGVLKYKHRKKQAENKLFETEENLNRVQDILYELEGQLEPLEMQASVAKDYLFQQEELEKFEVSLLVAEIEAAKEKMALQKADFAKNEEILAGLQAEIKQEETQIYTQKQSLATIDHEMEVTQAALLEVTERLEQLEGQRNVALERKKHSNENEQALHENLQQIESRIATFETQKQTLLQEKLEKETALEVFMKEKKALEAKLAEYDNLSEEKIESMKSDYIELRHTQTTMRNDIGYLERQLAQMQGRSDKLDHENQQHISERNEIIATVESLTEHATQMQEKLEDQVAHYQTIQQELAKHEAIFTKQEREMYRQYEAIQQAKSRKETLAELADDYAGFFQGVREVLKAKKKLNGILGAFVELVDIPEHYQKALEIALGANAQHIIVRDDQAARDAISYLKQTRAGRATFLPLSTIQPRQIPVATKNALEQQPAFVALASDVLTYDAQVENVILNALGTTILAKDLKGANTLAKLVNFRYRVVTLEGDVVNAGGSMTGGATAQGKSSIMTRKHELENLSKTIVQMTQTVEQTEKQFTKLKEEVQLKREQLEEARSVGETLRLQETELLGKKERAEERLTAANKQLQIYDMEKEEGNSEVELLTQRKAKLQQELATLAIEITDKDTLIQQMTEQSKEQEHNRASDQESYSTLKSSVAVSREQLQTTEQALANVEADISEYYVEKEAITSKLSMLKTNIETVHSSTEELATTINNAREEKETTTTNRDQLREKRVELQESLTVQEEVLQQKHNQASFYMEQKTAAEVSMSRLDADVGNRLDRLSEAYVLTFEAAKERAISEMDIDQARSKVRLLKRSIDELGVVNIGAIDEFERIKERFEFLNGQQEDLLEAKSTLFQVMDEMDEEMKKRFEESFTAIQTEFAIVFPELFGGGQARLILHNPEEVLTTGVDIEAQPPGKKLQNLSLLSGGERALTAIALLFAIIRVRPMPFCILDEVEAALDEANVTRFSRYLKKFETNIQFIVITHRKGTMEEADVLYGVTMQESGVSKLVSVRLEETAELIK